MNSVAISSDQSKSTRTLFCSKMTAIASKFAQSASQSLPTTQASTTLSASRQTSTAACAKQPCKQ